MEYVDPQLESMMQELGFSDLERKLVHTGHGLGTEFQQRLELVAILQQARTFAKATSALRESLANQSEREIEKHEEWQRRNSVHAESLALATQQLVASTSGLKNATT